MIILEVSIKTKNFFFIIALRNFQHYLIIFAWLLFSLRNKSIKNFLFLSVREINEWERKPFLWEKIRRNETWNKKFIKEQRENAIFKLLFSRMKRCFQPKLIFYFRKNCLECCIVSLWDTFIHFLVWISLLWYFSILAHSNINNSNDKLIN